MEILPLFSQPVYIDVVDLQPDVLKRAQHTPMQDMALDGAYKKNGFKTILETENQILFSKI